MAYNGETFICFWFKNIQCVVQLLYNSLEDQKPLKGNTVGSRLSVEKAYIAGFLDGDGSIMLQLKKRSDGSRGYRFMATICLYQDTRHDTPLYWMRETFGIGYISQRNDRMTELRIQGFAAVQKVLSELQPYIRFKTLQTEATIQACSLLQKKKLSQVDLLRLVQLVLAIQNENYQSTRKKTEEDLLKMLNLTP